MASKSVEDDLWMVRPCATYLDEFKECSSFRGRFHQKFIHGKASPCEQWQKDFDNCIAYRKTRSLVMAERVINSEKARKEKRLAASRANDIWEYRTSPPADWSKPLPDYLERMKLPSVNTAESRCTIS